MCIRDRLKDVKSDRYDILMPVKGHWKLSYSGHEEILSAGDTTLIKPNNNYRLEPSMSGEASLYRIANTSDTAGPTWFERN